MQRLFKNEEVWPLKRAYREWGVSASPGSSTQVRPVSEGRDTRIFMLQMQGALECSSEDGQMTIKSRVLVTPFPRCRALFFFLSLSPANHQPPKSGKRYEREQPQKITSADETLSRRRDYRILVGAGPDRDSSRAHAKAAIDGYCTPSALYLTVRHISVQAYISNAVDKSVYSGQPSMVGAMLMQANPGTGSRSKPTS